MMSCAHRALFALLLTSVVILTVSANDESHIDVVRIPKKDHKAAVKAHGTKEKVSTDDFVVRSPKAGIIHKEVKKHAPKASEEAGKSAPEHEVRKAAPIDVVRRRISPKHQQKLEAKQHQPRVGQRMEGQVVRSRKQIPAALLEERTPHEVPQNLEVSHNGELDQAEEPAEEGFEDVELRDKAPAEVVVTRHNNLPHLL